MRLVQAWEAKVAGREPTAGEQQIIDRYRRIAAGLDPDEHSYDPFQGGDTDDDI